MSLDPGRSSEDGRRLSDLFEMYRVAIEDLESLQDPAVVPLLRELEMLQRFVGGEQSQPKA